MMLDPPYMLLFRSDQKKMFFIRLAVLKEEEDNDFKLTIHTTTLRQNSSITIYLQTY